MPTNTPELPAAISCRFPAPPRSRTAFCGPWTGPSSTIADRISSSSGSGFLSGIKTIFKTKGAVFIYPSSGTGAWEASLSNVLSPGDRVLMYETGHFATLWKTMALKLGVKPEFIESDWRTGVDAGKIEEKLRADKESRDQGRLRRP